MTRFNKTGRTVEQQIKRRNTIAFIIFILLGCSAYTGWEWLHHQPKDQRVIAPLRKALNKNEEIFASSLSPAHLAKIYPKSMAAKNARVNGNIGLAKSMDVKTWRMQLVRKPGDTLYVSLDDLKKLPKTNLIFDFKCIEGWSQITDWAGVKFSDFVKHYGLTHQSKMKYIGISTPDKKYYVGIDMESALHPQTILCYELNDKPLPMNHGFPLRLIIPVKYGVKNIKCIGTLYFSDQKPPDYWAERGYDYFSGL
jgi:DMSO/TMAO reductase YedYZ molybdopterin-dependent catalytic subunit